MSAQQQSGVVDEQLIPIDIAYNRLLEWLVDRKRIVREWQSELPAVQAKISLAIQDMPDVPEITSILQEGSFINYFHCVRIVELLKVSESGSKNIFGQYSSKRMKDWVDIVKSYEKGWICLGEIAHVIIQNVNYEVPEMKRQLTRAQQQLKELDLKEASLMSSVAQHKAAFQASCKDLKITGQNVTSELLELVHELGPLYKSIVEMVRQPKFRQACELYRAFVQATFAEGGSEQAAARLPMAAFLQDKGNVTVHELRTGEHIEVAEHAPAKSSAAALAAPTELAQATEDAAAIDWGSGGVEDDMVVLDDGADINWDVVDDAGLAEGIISLDDVSNAGIETVVQGDTTTQTEAPVADAAAVASLDLAPEVVTADAAFSHETVLENTETRNSFVNDLLELQSFLTQRASELGAQSTVLAMHMFVSAAPILQDQTASSVAAYLASVQEPLQLLTASRTQQLILLKASPRYVDHLAETLLHELKAAQRMQSRIKDVEARRVEVGSHQETVRPKLAQLIAQTKVLQAQIEGELSRQYNGRKVHIIGQINTM
ncbi:hypothetical protein CAOG_06886 [Capsaspora owczarzaki ATCC 30864]|uniref:CDK5 regulatory subunit associated protein 3 n=1 Tax=Capsaspora owczarzaki (strain ATCC 30864) TaxID=595528 RepID=A0A0D2WW17_CAPO3|nr:hypothetical protein CAOG_06886 [Capsaspora owczarzaki ATCC 30864]KJE96583.1 hypothetical protein CAOG_006886 [Capsaspora owczarzaki ATCC 30864]|eukprot:XP_004344507.1 hypothetical protein CAOG_06886 [Capsaspora owczarzaki ATCC 30864]